MKSKLAALFFVWATPAAAWACSVCYCGDPTLLPLGILQPESGQLRLSLDGSFLEKDTGTVTPPTDRLFRHVGTNSDEHHAEFRLTMTGALTLNDTTFSAVVPWVSKTLTEKTGAAIKESALAGPGDLELYARQQWFLSPRIAKTRHILALSGGVKLPTGEYGEDPHLSPGSGSFDLLAGPSYTYDADPFSLFFSVLGRYNGENQNGFRYGSSLLGNMALRYRINDYVLVAVQLNGRITSRDQQGGLLDSNSGGSTLFVSPQVVVRPKSTWALRASVQQPVVNQLYGEQSESMVLQMGVSYDL
jgi:hypothetical protein